MVLLVVGCTRRATEVRVRDPGRVQVALREPPPPRPVLLPDPRPVAFQIANPTGRPGTLVRRERAVSFEQASDDPILLVDDDGLWPSTPNTDGFRTAGPFFYGAYDLADGRAYEPGRAPAGYVAVELSTPLDNVEHAEHVVERRKWPAYVTLPLGALFTILGVGLLTTSDDDLAEAAGGFYLAAGVPLIAYGVFVLADSPTTTPLVAPAAR